MDFLPVSVIIPSYNSCGLLRECVESIINKNNFIPEEIIIIDDFSTDDSLLIANSLALEYDFVNVIQKEKNEGATKARLSGVKKSKNNIIVFIDADDTVEIGLLKEAYSIYLESKCDMVMFSLLINKDVLRLVRPENELVSGREAFFLSIGGWGISGLGLVDKSLMLRSYSEINRITTKDYFAKDEEITRLCFINSKVIGITKRKYFYRTHSGQSTKNVKVSESEEFIRLYCGYKNMLRLTPISIYEEITKEEFLYFLFASSTYVVSKLNLVEDENIMSSAVSLVVDRKKILKKSKPILWKNLCLFYFRFYFRFINIWKKNS